MNNRSDDDARHAARALAGGSPLLTSTDAVFARVRNVGFSLRDIREARQVFDAITIGRAVEALEAATIKAARFAALLKLARVVKPYAASGQPGWFRFLIELGRRKGESAFQLSYSRRAQSETSKPKAALTRDTLTRSVFKSMFVAGAILRRIDAANAKGHRLTIVAAIDEAIGENEIGIGAEAAHKQWNSFRKDCQALTEGTGTFRLKQYDGPITQYVGRWVALPDVGIGLRRLPSREGGRPRKTK